MEEGHILQQHALNPREEHPSDIVDQHVQSTRGGSLELNARALTRLSARCPELISVRLLMAHFSRSVDVALSKLNSQSASPRTSPSSGIQCLPGEIILEIMVLAVESRQPSLVALELSHVCRRFRKLALSSGKIWSHIHPASHTHRMVELYAERNKSAGLDVTFTNKRFSANKRSHLQFLRAVVSSQAKWRSLTIELENRSIEGLLHLLNGLRQNEPLPKLNRICIKATRFYSQPFSAEEKDQIGALYSSLKADSLVNLATTDLVPTPLPPNLSQLTIYVHSRTNLSSAMHPNLDHNHSVKELNFVFYFPENDNNQVLSDEPTSFDKVDILRVQIPHVKKRAHIGAQILFAHVRLPKLRTLVLAYDFKIRYEAKAREMDLRNLEQYYLQDPLFQSGLELLVLKLYKTCQVDLECALPIAFQKMPEVQELQIETPHPLAPFENEIISMRRPAFRHIVFRECASLTSEWLLGFVRYLRYDDVAWQALEKITVLQCPMVDMSMMTETDDKVSCF